MVQEDKLNAKSVQQNDSCEVKRQKPTPQLKRDVVWIRRPSHAVRFATPAALPGQDSWQQVSLRRCQTSQSRALGLTAKNMHVLFLPLPAEPWRQQHTCNVGTCSELYLSPTGELRDLAQKRRATENTRRSALARR